MTKLWPDIDFVISFLYTRVTKSSQEDWEKLRRLLRYINGTIKMKRIIGADNLGIARRCLDASYAMYKEKESHWGDFLHETWDRPS